MFIPNLSHLDAAEYLLAWDSGALVRARLLVLILVRFLRQVELVEMFNRRLRGPRDSATRFW